MENRRKWKSFGWEGSLLLVGALAAGVFAATASCEDSSKMGALGPSGAGGIGQIGGDRGSAYAGR